MNDAEVMAQQDAIKKWAFKKMQKLAKKLNKFAEIYFGEPVAIIYCRKSKTKFIQHNVSKGDVSE